jgi:hypothetical protein
MPELVDACFNAMEAACQDEPPLSLDLHAHLCQGILMPLDVHFDDLDAFGHGHQTARCRKPALAEPVTCQGHAATDADLLVSTGAFMTFS